MQTNNLRDLAPKTNFCWSTRNRHYNITKKEFKYTISPTKDVDDDNILLQMVKLIARNYENTIKENQLKIKAFSLSLYGKTPVYYEKETTELYQKILKFMSNVKKSPEEIKKIISNHLGYKASFFHKGRFLSLQTIEKAYNQVINKESFIVVENTLYGL